MLASYCSLPTYILSECVLVYMEPRDSSALLAWAARMFSTAAVVIYEQVCVQATGMC